jgi:hypothetical protein
MLFIHVFIYVACLLFILLGVYGSVMGMQYSKYQKINSVPGGNQSTDLE